VVFADGTKRVYITLGRGQSSSTRGAWVTKMTKSQGGDDDWVVVM
jgi:hypothetical protein